MRLIVEIQLSPQFTLDASSDRHKANPPHQYAHLAKEEIDRQVKGEH